MYRRYRERRTRHHHHTSENRKNLGRTLTSAFRRPGTQVAALAVVALIVYLILQAGNTPSSLPKKEISVNEAYAKYQQRAFFIDIRTQQEWREYHIPNTSLVPLEQLVTRLNDLPRDRDIVIVGNTSASSQQGRDLLLNAGFTRVSNMSGSLSDWRASGYPTEP